LQSIPKPINNDCTVFKSLYAVLLNLNHLKKQEMKKNFLLAIFALLIFGANAQPPTSAPTPTQSASDVISVFSQSYSSLSGTDFNPNWGQGTIVSDYIISGDTIKKYQNLDYQGTQFASPINASSMENLHVDIYTDNGATFDFYLVNTTTGQEQKYRLTPTQSGWVSYDIPLSSYAAGIVSNIGQFKFVDEPMQYHSSTKTYYLDNIYFWKSANTPTISGFSFPIKYTTDAPFTITAPTSNSSGAFTYSSSNTGVATISGNTITIIGAGSTIITANQAADGSYGPGSTTATLLVTFAPPSTNPSTPTQLSSNVISVFSDAYTNVAGTNFYPNWGQSTTHLDMTVSGNTIKRYDNLNYEGIEFASDLNVASMETLHFDIWTPNCSTFDFYLINTAPQFEKKVTVNPSLSGWNSFDIPLTSYNGVDLTKVRQFKLVGNNGSTIYLDNIYFWKSASSPTITGFSVPAKNLGDAAFNLTDPTSNSTGAFTYTSSNTNVATISGNTVTIVGVGSTTITANQAADGTYNAGSTSAVFVVSYPPPPTAAPDPTRASTDVLSLFSGVYTNISGTDWYPNWGQSTVVSDISIGGNTTKKYSNLNYQGVQFASPVDASQMTELHLDLWTPNCTAFDVFLINAGGVEQSVRLNPTLSGWNSFDISLSAYTTINKSAIIQFKLVGTPFGSSAVYLDNIYFWKATPVTLGTFTVPAKQVGDAVFALTAPTSNSPGTFSYSSSNTNVATINGSMVTIVGAGTSTITATQAASGNYGSASTTADLVVTYPPLPSAPITAAATPTKPAANVISLFSNAYTNVTGTDFFPNWGQSTQVADTSIEGNTTKKYTNLNYQGIQFAGTIDASEALYLHADIWTSTCTAFQIFLINTATGAEVPYTLNPTLGGWNSYDIALTNYPSNIVNHVNQIKLVGTPFGSSKVYMDNLYFWANTCINHVTAPSVSIASSANNVCENTNITITATPTNGGTSPNYNFKVNGMSVQNGSNDTYTTNTLTNGKVVTCVITRTDGCATDGMSNSITMNLLSGPSIGTSSNLVFCDLGVTKNIYNSNTSGGGVWSSSDVNIATVTTPGVTSGIVASIANGTATLTYTKTGANGCTSTASSTVTVAVMNSPAAITGASSVCVGSSIQLSNTTSGGVWSSYNNRGTINVSGMYSGVNAGTGDIRYTVTNASGCSAYVSKSITVNTIPGIPSISYAPGTVNPQSGAAGSYCTNRTFTVVGSPSGGVWSKTGVISVTTPAGVVSTGNTPGAASLTYTYTNGNGCSNSRTIASNVVTCAFRGMNIDAQEALTTNNYSIYPNPAKSFISVKADVLIGKGKIVITDLLGKQVKSQSISLGNNTIDISMLNKGFYLINIISDDSKQIQKLIIE